MDGYDQERRGLFDGLTVPHSLNAIIIAAIGLFVYWLGIIAMENMFADSIPGEGHCRIIAGMLGNMTARLGVPGALLAATGGWENELSPYSAGVWLIFLGWSAVVWSFFSGAINRIAAMKIAREEGLELKEAIKFGAQKFLPNLLSIVFVFVIGGIFYLLCNATIAGWVGSVDYVGGVLLGILFFLVLISSFLTVFIGALGILGFNLSSSAIATEASDTFDGVSRAWNYILARPWTVLLTFTATFMYLGLVIFFGNQFLRVSVKSLSVGWWGLGNTPRAVEVDDEVRKKAELPATVRHILLPGKGEYLYHRVIYKEYRPKKGRIFYRQGLEYSLETYRGHMGRYPATLQDLLEKPKDYEQPKDLKGWSGPYLDGKTVPVDRWGNAFVFEVEDPKKPGAYKLFSKGKDEQAGTADDKQIEDVEAMIGPRGPALDIAPYIEKTVNFSAHATMFWVNLARVLLYAYVVAYFLSAQTMVYFLLRKDVEGDDYGEITLDDEFEDEGAFEFASAPPPKKAEEKKDGGKPLPAAGGDDPKPEA